MFSLAVVFLLLLNGCIKTLNEDLKAKESKLVLNAIINPDSILSVNLSHTFNVFDDESSTNLPFIDYANIEVYENDNYLFNLINKDLGNYSKEGFFPKAGKQYTLKIAANAYKNIEAKTQIPRKTIINNFDTTHIIYSDEYSKSTIYFGHITYQDTPGEDNYYQLKCVSLRRISGQGEQEWVYEHLWVDENSSSFFDKSWGNLLWSDKYSDGKEVSVRFGFYDKYEDDYNVNTLIDTVRYVFSLQSIDRDYFLYLKTKGLYDETDGGSDPFMEPVVVYNNVENGYGIFGAFQQDTTSTRVIIEYLVEGK